jgi:hypothetical protein
LQSDSYLAGSRFFLGYTGSAPSGANCTTLAGDIESAWTSHIAPLIDQNTALKEIDVLDIATDSGLSGQWTGTSAGGLTGTPVPGFIATNVEFNISRRYRGGKPRMFLPSADTSDQLDGSHWNSTYVSAVNAGVAAFFAAIEALSVGSMGTLDHVNLSYYKGFTNIANSSGRERAVPTYRAAALLDPVVGYSCKAEMSTQKRRRTALTY